MPTDHTAHKIRVIDSAYPRVTPTPRYRENETMSRKIVAIGLDSPNNAIVENWLNSGLLPNLAALRSESSWGIVSHHKDNNDQNSWIPFLTGRSLHKIDHWLSSYQPKDYANSENSLFNAHAHQPFYALGARARVVMFDLPAPMNHNVAGIQIAGWATELNETFSASIPPSAIADIHDKYGMDPKLEGALEYYNREFDRHSLSYQVPSPYDTGALKLFRDKVLAATTTRGKICRDLLEEHDCDLFVTEFPEIHTAGHTFWHLSQVHPLAGLSAAFDSDPLLQIYQAVDREIGLIADAVGRDDELIVFSVDSLTVDCLEIARSLFLPEFLYRWSFPGKVALAAGDAGTPPPEPRLDYLLHWKHEVWELRTDDGERDLQSPKEQYAQNDTFNWQPTNWYKPVWERMKAFALPSVADGYIRVNVKGREARGLIEPRQFQDACDEICSRLAELVDARTGLRMVDRVVQTRNDPFDVDARSCPADLIVLWQDQSPTDVVESPLVGRIGPVPYFRPGGHQKQGTKIENFFMVRAADCSPRKPFAEGRLEDLPATILTRMGIDIPDHFDGRPLDFAADTESAANV